MRVHCRGGVSSNRNSETNEEPLQATTTWENSDSEDIIYDYPIMRFENAEFIDTIQNEDYAIAGRISGHLNKQK